MSAHDSKAGPAPNPQGKGQVLVTAALAEAHSRVVAMPKSAEQISLELFTALFVLESEFRFKPVVGKRYWIYRRGERFRLSLVSPVEWGTSPLGDEVGEAVLQPDMSWTLSLSPSAEADAELMAMIAGRREAFEQHMQEAESLAEAMPYYVESLPFYARVFAAGLAGSLRDSALAEGIAQLSYEQALRRLSHPSEQHTL